MYSLLQCSSTVRTVRTGAYERKKSAYEKNGAYKSAYESKSAYEKNVRTSNFAMAHKFKAVSTVLPKNFACGAFLTIFFIQIIVKS